MGCKISKVQDDIMVNPEGVQAAVFLAKTILDAYDPEEQSRLQPVGPSERRRQSLEAYRNSQRTSCVTSSNLASSTGVPSPASPGPCPGAKVNETPRPSLPYVSKAESHEQGEGMGFKAIRRGSYSLVSTAISSQPESSTTTMALGLAGKVSHKGPPANAFSDPLSSNSRHGHPLTSNQPSLRAAYHDGHAAPTSPINPSLLVAAMEALSSSAAAAGRHSNVH